jgi:hypothetical protein
MKLPLIITSILFSGFCFGQEPTIPLQEVIGIVRKADHLKGLKIKILLDDEEIPTNDNRELPLDILNRVRFEKTKDSLEREEYVRISIRTKEPNPL